MAPALAVLQGHSAEQRLRGPLEARRIRVGARSRQAGHPPSPAASPASPAPAPTVTTEAELAPLLAAGHRVGAVWTTAVRPAAWLRRLAAAAPSFNHLCGFDALHHKGKLAFLCEIAPALRRAGGLLPSRLVRDAASAAAAAADVSARWPDAWWILKDAEVRRRVSRAGCVSGPRPAGPVSVTCAPLFAGAVRRPQMGGAAPRAGFARCSAGRRGAGAGCARSSQAHAGRSPPCAHAHSCADAAPLRLAAPPVPPRCRRI